MGRAAVAMDLGTSGFRAQAVDYGSGRILGTVITTGHPLAGANVMDHLHFALEMGVEKAQQIILDLINKIIQALPVPPDQIGRLGICGNPVQLSLVQAMEIKDLIYAGTREKELLQVSAPDRTGRIIKACKIKHLGLPDDCDIIIPPAIHHTVGADGLALIVHSGMMRRDENSLATDYGTNAEMALHCDGKIYTASAAAGPALEGQQIRCGTLAAPGALVDINKVGDYFQCIVLDDQLLPVPGPFTTLQQLTKTADAPLIGITGTGCIALIEQAMGRGLIKLPSILTADKTLHLSPEVSFSEQDLHEAGKAIGAIQAGHLTLCNAAGLAASDIDTCYMAGASGTYVDALKAQKLGLLPGQVRHVEQLGNTSLKMAVELVLLPNILEKLNRIAEQIAKDHCMLAASSVFKSLFILELSRWTEGLPEDMYRKLLSHYGLADIQPITAPATDINRQARDIEDLGPGGALFLKPKCKIARDIPECTGCGACIQECPGQALEATEAAANTLWLETSRCNGVGCRRCERMCPEEVFSLNTFFIA